MVNGFDISTATDLEKIEYLLESSRQIATSMAGTLEVVEKILLRMQPIEKESANHRLLLDNMKMRWRQQTDINATLIKRLDQMEQRLAVQETQNAKQKETESIREGEPIHKEGEEETRTGLFGSGYGSTASEESSGKGVDAAEEKPVLEYDDASVSGRVHQRIDDNLKGE